MRFRWKLLILLLFISVLPILLIRPFAVHRIRSFGDRIADLTGRYLLQNTRDRMRLLADGYTALLSAEKKRIEYAIDIFAREAESVLSTPAPQTTAEPLLITRDFDRRKLPPVQTVFTPFHFWRGMEGEKRPIPVSFNAPVFKTAPGVSMREVEADAKKLQRLLPLCTDIQSSFSDIVLWQYITLDTGLLFAYPGHGHLARSLDPRKMSWYRPDSNWTEAFVDPATRRIVFAAIRPIRRPSGETAGVAAFLLPVRILTESRFMQIHLPRKTRSFLTDACRESDLLTDQIRIIARNDYSDLRHRSWRAQIDEKRLTSSNAAEYKKMVADFHRGTDNIRRMPYQGEDSLWVYGQLDQWSYIVLITPYEEILKPSKDLQKLLQNMTQSVLKLTRFIALGAICLVLILVLLFSRTVTRPLNTLTEGAKRLAEGDFTTRVHIRTGDEFEEMGNVFNNVVPRLEENTVLNQSLKLAREIQQNLLPKEPPPAAGLDVWGKSRYCDKTGGDYYDFIPSPTGDGSPLQVVVGDVSGHGIPSALLMATARAFIRIRAFIPGTPAELITDVNRHLSRDVEDSGQFITLFYMVFHTDRNIMSWVCAGHDPALVYNTRTDAFRDLGGKHLPLAVYETSRYRESEIKYDSGWIILIGTDGIWETRNPQGEIFGKDRVKAVLREHQDKPAHGIIAALESDLTAFRGVEKPEDDVTMVVIKT